MRRVVAGQRVSGRKREMVEVLVHLQDGVDRALLRSGHVARDVNHALQILVIDAALDRFVVDGHQLAQGDHGAVRAGQADILQSPARRSGRRGQLRRWRAQARARSDRGCRPTCVPEMASARAWATSETAMPCCAALTSSTRITSRGCGSSTYQSVSTTPGVC